jgi:hypothetical protein
MSNIMQLLAGQNAQARVGADDVGYGTIFNQAPTNYGLNNLTGDWLKNLSTIPAMQKGMDAPAKSWVDGWASKENGGMYNLGNMGLSALQGLASYMTSNKQMKMAKNQLAFQKDAFAQNMALQKQQYNNSKEDIYTARRSGMSDEQRAATPNTQEYMKKHGL